MSKRYDLQKNRLFSSYIISGIHQGINAYIRQNSSYIPLPAQFAQTVEIVKAEKEKYSSDSYYYMSKKNKRGNRAQAERGGIGSLLYRTAHFLRGLL